MKILIAEDDRTSSLIMTAVVKKWGYTPVTVGDGMQAWRALQAPDAPRLLLLDWNMPELDGIAVCRMIRAKGGDDPPYIIMLTSNSEKMNVIEGLEAGANDYITKPYDNGELRARIKVGQRMLEMQEEVLEAKRVLAFQATHDPLTEVFNRRALFAHLERALGKAQVEGRPFSLGLCDLDHFKKINDVHGHQAGDDVLVGFARLVQARLSGEAFMGRYGGEEFVIGLPGLEGLERDVFFQDLCRDVAAAELPTQTGALRITVSIGVAQCSDGCSAAQLINAADAALYVAKEAGRDRVCFA